MRSVALSWEVVNLIEGSGRDADGNERPKLGRIFSAHGNFDLSTADGVLRFNIMQSIAQYERENRARDWQSARLRAFERGVWLARAPFGYVRLPEDLKRARPEADGVIVGVGGLRFDTGEIEEMVTGGLVTHPVYGSLMAELFARRRAGASLTELARWLTAEAPRDGGAAWDPGVVGKMLTNRAYLGEERYEHKPEPLWRERGHRPLVDADAFDAVQRAPPGLPLRRRRAYGCRKCVGGRIRLRSS
jgi:hypothetical protein